MLGHVYFDETFSTQFIALLEQLEDNSDYWHHVWEYLYIHHMDTLSLEIRKFNQQEILEFDSVDEAVEFDREFLRNNCVGQFFSSRSN